jgi:hypothetical protein
MEVDQKFTAPPPRFSEASLIKKLEEEIRQKDRMAAIGRMKSPTLPTIAVNSRRASMRCLSRRALQATAAIRSQRMHRGSCLCREESRQALREANEAARRLLEQWWRWHFDEQVREESLLDAMMSGVWTFAGWSPDMIDTGLRAAPSRRSRAGIRRSREIRST